MAGGNRAVILLRVPPELKWITECYQRDRRLPSLQAAVIELLETHPRLAEVMEAVYAVARQDTTRGD